MADKRLIDFINKNLKKGINEQNILNSLLKKGWDKNLVDEAFSLVKGPSSKKEEKTEEEPFKDFDSSEEVPKEKTKEQKEVQEVKKETSKEPKKSKQEKRDKKEKKQRKKEIKKTKEEPISKEKPEKAKEPKESPLKTLMIMVVLLGVLIGIFLLFGFTSQTLTEKDLINGTTILLGEGKSVSFSLEGNHKLSVEKIEEKAVSFKLESKIYEFVLGVGKEKKIDFGSDGDYDLLIKVISISDEAEIYLSKLTRSFCEENWECTDWSDCVNDFQNRTCIDLNKCGSLESMPKEVRPCCKENWECTDWSECIGGTQTRSCTDLNKCETDFEKPSETRSCETSSDSVDNETVNETHENNLSSEEKLCLNLEGYVCNDLEYCNNSQHNIQNSDVICCQEECIPASDYFGESYTSVKWSDKLNHFKSNATYCQTGYNILVNLSTANVNYKTGINTTKRVKFEIIGIDSQGKCKIKGNYSYYNINYTKKMRDYLLQQGNTTEEINQEVNELNSESDSYIEASAMCRYDATYLEDKIDEWKSGNYTSAFEGLNGKFDEFSCEGDEKAPLIN